MRESVRVLHVVPGFNYGGIEKRLVDWYSLMDREKISFDVVKVTPDNPNTLVESIRTLGGEVFSIPPLGSKTFIKHFKEMRQVISKGGYDVIHAHSLAYGCYALKIAKQMGIPIRILHSRSVGDNPGERMVTIKRVMAKDSLKYANHYFACSQEAGEYAFHDKGFEIINNGIILADYVFNKEKRESRRMELGFADETVLGYVGRFSTVKNIPFLFEVFARAHQQIPKLKLLVVGDVKDDASLFCEVNRIIETRGLASDVIFAGRKDNVGEWLSAMDIFLLPSLHESFGAVAIEAQANGLPCLVSERIPRITKVSDKIVYLPLNDADTWVDTIREWRYLDRVSGDTKRIAEAGFDVHTTAIFLQDFYLNS